jgi:hypoxanthine phosphoribosyltransferase
MRLLSWQDFDQAVERLSRRCLASAAGGSRRFTGIHGIPRGGLVLAVTLSHRLELPLLSEAQPGCLVVDDIHETGRTLAPYRQLDGCQLMVWISKTELDGLWAAEEMRSPEWVLFPWENRQRAEADAQAYRESRG